MAAWAACDEEGQCGGRGSSCAQGTSPLQAGHARELGEARRARGRAAAPASSVPLSLVVSLTCVLRLCRVGRCRAGAYSHTCLRFPEALRHSNLSHELHCRCCGIKGRRARHGVTAPRLSRQFRSCANGDFESSGGSGTVSTALADSLRRAADVPELVDVVWHAPAPGFLLSGEQTPPPAWSSRPDVPQRHRAPRSRKSLPFDQCLKSP